LEKVGRTVDAVRSPAEDTAFTTLEALLRILREEPTGAAATGTGVAATSYAGWRGIRWLVPFLVPLYARLRGHDLARHPKRAALLAIIHEQPGATTRDLVAKTRMNEGTALHHLRALQRGGLLVSRRVGRDRSWHDAAASAKPQEDALREPARRAIIDLASQRPGLTQAEIARALGCAKATVHHHVDHLRAVGLIETRRDGLRTRCFVAA
jgi:DNA-binding MarR family transcriptional regulator